MRGIGRLLGRLGVALPALALQVGSFSHPVPMTTKAPCGNPLQTLLFGRQPSLLMDSARSPRNLQLSSAAPGSSSISSSSCLRLWRASVGAVPSAVVSAARLSLVMAAAAALLLNARRILWPRAQADPRFFEPLPPGSLGCPLLGTPFLLGSKKWGAGSFYRTRVQKLPGWPRLFKFYFLGTPFVAVSGYKRLQKLLNREFDDDGLEAAPLLNRVGRESLIGETDKGRHQFLRRLIGQALTPTAVATAVPVLQQAAQIQVDRLLSVSKPVRADRVCTDYTLDVAWRQILGLDLADDEIPAFVRAVDDWLAGVASLRSILGWRVEETKAYKSFKYLEAKVNEKIDDLERNGPDGISTLSGMVFATDEPLEEENPTLDGPVARRKLSRSQVVDNAMVLILAGSETSASTLTNAMALLGLHKDTWNKLVEEQRAVRAKFGDALTKEALDKECPYLEAVVKESLRIRPIMGGIPRKVKKTIVVDGVQIPKGWVVDWSAPLSHELDPKTFQPDGSHMDILKGFVPERWLEEETTPVDFVPMGVGPRYCLGFHLAYTEMKVFLAVLARNLDFDLASDDAGSIVWQRVSIIPKIENGVPIVFRPLHPVPMPSALPPVTT